MIPILPEGYLWRNEEGLYQCSQSKEKKIANGYCRILGYYRDVNAVNESNDVAEVEFIIIVDDVEKHHKAIVPINALKSRDRCYRYFPLELVFEPRKRNVGVEVMEWCIKNGINKCERVERPVGSYMWYKKKYFSGHYNVKGNFTENSCAMALCCLIVESDGFLGGVVLEAIHGPLKKPLLDAGIKHDFVGVVLGKTDTGKTSSSEKILEYPKDGGVNNAYNLASTRKDLFKTIHNATDITIFLDDLCKTKSVRTAARLFQTASEIIQLASDGKILADNDCGNQFELRCHLYMSSEFMSENPSTINRCFIMEMEEQLSDQCWKKLIMYEENGWRSFFMDNFLRYVSENYDDIVTEMKESYECYYNEASFGTEHSHTRIKNTYAVQHVLKDVLMKYLEKVQVDKGVREKVHNKISYVIYVGCKNVVDREEDAAEIMHEARYIPALLNILSNAEQDMENDRKSIVYSEKKYMKKSSEALFLCVNDGYVSFKGNRMCREIAPIVDEEVVCSRQLTDELAQYQLAHVAPNRDIACKWNTGSRMIHVNVRALYEWDYGTFIDDGIYSLDMIDRIINKYYLADRQ